MSRLEDITPIAHIEPHQFAEFERARVVLVFRPELAVWMNCLHPAGALYEQPIDPNNAFDQHSQFQAVLEKYGCKVYTVTQVLKEGTEHPQIRRELVELAARSLTYVLVNGDDSEFIRAQYKEKVLNIMNVSALTDIIMTHPTVNLRLDSRNTGIETESISFRPSGNCVFTRDQQITTMRGLVIANFAASQRSEEAHILEFVLRKLGISPVGFIREFNYKRESYHRQTVKSNATLEGGDFLLFDKQTCALGVGLRTSYSAAIHMMEQDLLGSPKFLVVKDVFDHNQDRMHLDCTCSPLHEKLILVDEKVLNDPHCHRFVDEWQHMGNYDADLKSFYEIVPGATNVEFGKYLHDAGYTVIPLPHKYQLKYGCNMLNLGSIDGVYRILTVHEDSRNYIMNHPLFKQYCVRMSINIQIEYVPFRSITSMYGSLHCASQVLVRDDDTTDPRQITRRPSFITGRHHFDCVVVVPNFLSNTKLVEEVYALAHELIDQNKKVYLQTRYWVDHHFSLQRMKPGISSVAQWIDSFFGPENAELSVDSNYNYSIDDFFYYLEDDK